MTRILVADDSETILLLVRTRLEMEGYDVTTANDGHEAEAALDVPDGDRPDIVVLDAMMPGKSGLDVLKGLRADGDKIPVLIISAHREEEGLGDAEQMGAEGFVGKPIDFDDLLQRIQTLTT